MGLFDWLFKQRRFTRFEDAFTLTRESLWGALQECLESPLHVDKSIWLVVHFMDTFSELQDRLESWNLDYDVIASRLETGEVDRDGLLSGSKIKLILAELIPEPAEIAQFVDDTEKRKLAMIVTERHPFLEEDNRLKRFAMSLPIFVEFGYYLALDDEVVKLAVEETMIQILKQMGMDDHALITSNLVTNRLNKVLKRMGPNFSGNTRANSAADWLLVNQANKSDHTNG